MSATETKTMTLREFNNESPITYLWLCGVGCPAGLDFNHDTETDDEEEYCDFAELDILNGCRDNVDEDGNCLQPGLWELEGEIDAEGRWCWDGDGDVLDERGNTIYNVKASR